MHSSDNCDAYLRTCSILQGRFNASTEFCGARLSASVLCPCPLRLSRRESPQPRPAQPRPRLQRPSPQPRPHASASSPPARSPRSPPARPLSVSARPAPNLPVPHHRVNTAKMYVPAAPPPCSPTLVPRRLTYRPDVRLRSPGPRSVAPFPRSLSGARQLARQAGRHLGQALRRSAGTRALSTAGRAEDKTRDVLLCRRARWGGGTSGRRSCCCRGPCCRDSVASSSSTPAHVRLPPPTRRRQLPPLPPPTRHPPPVPHRRLSRRRRLPSLHRRLPEPPPLAELPRAVAAV